MAEISRKAMKLASKGNGMNADEHEADRDDCEAEQYIACHASSREPKRRACEQHQCGAAPLQRSLISPLAQHRLGILAQRWIHLGAGEAAPT